jgi:fumarate hydratase class II
LNPVIGYDAAAEVAKQAQRESRSIREIVLEKELLTEAEFDALILRSVERDDIEISASSSMKPHP